MSSFKTSLRQGDIGEAIFFQAHAGELVRENGRARDFSLRFGGEGVELKTDLYPMEKTPNFFIERWSDVDAGKPGGPWQSVANGTKWFVYFYVNGLSVFRFDAEELCKAVEALEPSLTVKRIPNKTWTTVGYLVPREAVSHLAKQYTLSVSVTYE